MQGMQRPWLWDFLSWCVKEWNVVQDFYWINTSVCSTAHSKYGLMRGAVKQVVWLGDSDCNRYQDAVLAPLAAATLADKRITQDKSTTTPSGRHMNHGRCYRKAIQRGGSTPFNYMLCGNNGPNKHSASTPYKLTEWWIKYCTKPDDLVVDPFAGSDTTGIVCKNLGRRYVGIDIIGEKK
jgi:hypothetical protein